MVRQNICRICQKTTIGSQRKYCDECRPSAARAWDRARKARYKKERRCTSCHQYMVGKQDVGLVRCDSCRQKFNAYTNKNNLELKLETFRAYGGLLCVCCGESEPCFLSLDHINDDGAKDRRQRGYPGGDTLYRNLRKEGWPPGYQVLCHNCNHGRYINGGTCPHRKSREV